MVVFVVFVDEQGQDETDRMSDDLRDLMSSFQSLFYYFLKEREFSHILLMNHQNNLVVCIRYSVFNKIGLD